MMCEINHAADEQTRDIEEVKRAAIMLDQMVQQNATLVGESAAAASALHSQANTLAQVVGQFELTSGAGGLG